MTIRTAEGRVPTSLKMTGRLAAACLLLEAFLVLFATLVAFRLVSLPDGTVWAAGAALAATAILLAGLARSRIGLLLGTAYQLVLVATGFWVPAMFVLGLLFTALWCWLIRIGFHVDRARAAAPPPTPPS